MGPKHGNFPPSDAETISCSEEKSALDRIRPEAYEEALDDDPVLIGCLKVVDPSQGTYKPHKMCCGRLTTVRCPFCNFPLCKEHTGQCSIKGCEQKQRTAKRQSSELELAPFSPDTSEPEDRAGGAARELPARLMPV